MTARNFASGEYLESFVDVGFTVLTKEELLAARTTVSKERRSVKLYKQKHSAKSELINYTDSVFAF